MCAPRQLICIASTNIAYDDKNLWLNSPWWWYIVWWRASDDADVDIVG